VILVLAPDYQTAHYAATRIYKLPKKDWEYIRGIEDIRGYGKGSWYITYFPTGLRDYIEFRELITHCHTHGIKDYTSDC
jgi:hypothetical protein